MPTTYAHQKFSLDAINLLPNSLSKMINDNFDLFLLSSQGADFFYFASLSKNNPLRQKGRALHVCAQSELLTRVASSDLALDKKVAVGMGLVSHFILDKNCHAVIDSKVIATATPRQEYNCEFDRFLQLQDKIDPFSLNKTEKLVLNDENAKILATVFDCEEKIFKKTFKKYVFFTKLCNGNRFFSSLLRFLLTCSIFFSKYKSLVKPKKARHFETCRELFEVYKNSQTEFMVLARDFYLFVKGEKDLSVAFDTSSCEPEPKELALSNKK